MAWVKTSDGSLRSRKESAAWASRIRESARNQVGTGSRREFGMPDELEEEPYGQPVLRDIFASANAARCPSFLDSGVAAHGSGSPMEASNRGTRPRVTGRGFCVNAQGGIVE
jgi:hypothetical protein